MLFLLLDRSSRVLGGGWGPGAAALFFLVIAAVLDDGDNTLLTEAVLSTFFTARDVPFTKILEEVLT
jgi:hypothetical protein